MGGYSPATLTHKTDCHGAEVRGDPHSHLGLEWGGETGNQVSLLEETLIKTESLERRAVGEAGPPGRTGRQEAGGHRNGLPGAQVEAPEPASVAEK